MEPNINKDDSSSSLEALTSLGQPMTSIKTASMKKKRQIVVIDDCLLKGTKSPICKPDPLLREVWPGARVKGVVIKVPTLV